MAGKTSDGATNLMECPICSKSFKLSLINRHVNDCLASTGVIDSQDVSAINTRKRKASDESPVKKSSFASSSGSVVGEEPSTKTAWGSLMPQSPLSSGSKKKKKKVANTPSLTSPDKDTNESPKSPKLQSQILPQTKSPLHENESDHGSSQPSSSKGALMFEKNKTGTSKSSTPKAGAKSPTKKSGSKKSTKGIDKLDAEISESIPADHDGNRREETKTEEQMNGFKSDVIGRNYSNLNFNIPLAETARPTSLDDYIGQEQAVGKKSSLCLLLKNNDIPSIILWGPPGCGKTTLAKIIANSCKNKGKYKFCTMSATSAGVNDVKEAVKVAKNDLKMFKRRTIIFLDEIHRFNKLQQDALLPHVEDGTIVLIGATTENPSFQVNNALLSRCKVIVLEKLEVPEIETVLTRALDMLGVRVFTKKSEMKNKDGSSIWIEREAVTTLAGLCDGDARCALNSLQLAIQSQLSASKEKSTNSCTSSGKSTAESPVIIDKEIIKEGLQRSHVLYDRAGEEHYNIISALHKSMRGSDENAALYWLARMLEGGETPLYIARRLVRFASEDIGLADPQALNMAVSTYQACHFLGMPECDVILAHCAVYMSRAAKSVEVYKAYGKAKQLVRNHKGPMPGVPLHLRNAPTKLMKSIGYGKNYKYNPDFKDPVDQAYLPPELMGVNFFT